MNPNEEQDMNHQVAKRYLRIPEASREYNISIALLRKLIFQGRIASVRPAGARVVLISRDALEELMSQGRRP